MIPNFESFIAQLTEGTDVQSFSGFSVIYNKLLDKETNLTGNLTLTPDYLTNQKHHPIEIPCSYSIFLNGNFYDMPYSISTSKDQFMLLRLSIPLATNSNISFTSIVDEIETIFQPKIGVTMNHSGKKYTVDFSTDITDNFQSIIFNLLSTFSPLPQFCLGTALTVPISILQQNIAPSFLIGFLNDKTKLININDKINDPKNKLQKLYYHDLSNQFREGRKYSLQIHISNAVSLRFASLYTIQPKTTAGVSFSATYPFSQSPQHFESECQIGFQRNFLLGSCSAAFTSHGTLQSTFMRNVKDGVVINFSASSNFPTKIHSFGVSLVLQS